MRICNGANTHYSGEQNRTEQNRTEYTLYDNFKIKGVLINVRFIFN